MKLAQLQEARYAFPNYAQWVQTVFDSDTETDGEITVDIDRDLVIKQLVDAFGKPRYTYSELANSIEWMWTTPERWQHQILFFPRDMKLIASRWATAGSDEPFRQADWR